MKWLLARIGLPKAIGLYLNEGTITLSQVVATPLGPVEIAHKKEVLGDDSLSEVVQRLLGPLLGKKKFRRIPVSVGIPSKRVYFSARPVHAAMGEESSPHVLLREALNTQSIPVNDMIVDVVKDKPDVREVASIVACDKTYLAEIFDALKTLDVFPNLIEPAPCGLLRLASRRYRSRRGAKVVLRMFLSDTEVLTVFVVNNRPLLWRFSHLQQGEEAAAMLTACRSLLATSKDCGVESSLDAVMIHGREEIARLVDVEWIKSQLDVSLKWHDGPALEESQIALGIAQGGFDRSDAALNLGRSLKPRATLWRLFPWREAAVQCSLLACMGLFLGYKYLDLQDIQRDLRASVALSPVKIQENRPKLEKEKKEREAEILAIREFLDTRVLWTSCMRDLTVCVPEDMYLTAIRGLGQYQTADQKKRSGGRIKHSFVICGAVTMPPSGLVPREIDRLLVSLRSDPTLQQYFPVVTLQELQERKAIGRELPSANFSIECVPDGASGPHKAPQAKSATAKSEKPK
jgi:hypothetical protein